MIWSRRDVCRLALGGLVLSQGLPRALAAAAPSPPRARYVVIVHVFGGLDSIFTTDPRTASEVEPWVDVPYPREQIIEAGGRLVGPHLRPLLPTLPRLAIVNGVKVGTANHITGTMQMSRLRTRVSHHMPGILDIVAAHRDAQPLGSITLGLNDMLQFTPGWFGGSEVAQEDGRTRLWSEIEAQTPADLDLLARALRRQASGLASRSDPALRTTAGSLSQAAALFERLESVAPMKLARWDAGPEQQAASRALQRALWALENDLTSGVLFFTAPQSWDSHQNNSDEQTAESGKFFPLLNRFLEELERRSNAHGTLAANTVVLIGSELGRFPRVNGLKGKDHFPEAPYLLAGPGISGAGKTFGRTGRHMEGLPISLRTGTDAPFGEGLSLDDLGAAVLRLTGISPERYGYPARRLPFLVDA